MSKEAARTSALLALSTWLVAYAFWLAMAAISQPLTVSILFSAGLSLSTGFGLSIVIYGVSARTVALSAWRRALVLGVLVLLATTLHSVVDTLTLGLALRGDIPFGPNALATNFAAAFTYLIWAQSFTAAAMALITAAAERVFQERRIATAEAAARQAQLSALRLQINPHFLFNTLNSAAALVAARRNDEAEELIVRLSEFFRGTLEEPQDGRTSLAHEFGTLGAYLDIEAVRFGDKLATSMSWPPELAAAEMPAFLIQPLVENAIKHGVAPSKTAVAVDVSARRDGDHLIVRVWNEAHSGPATTAESGGVGLSNVRARLAALYGDRARLETSLRDGGFLAEIRMPLTFSEDHG